MMDWMQCKAKGTAKRISYDENLIKSLSDASGKKWKSQEMLSINDITISSKITLAYDSLRELLEALALKHGYKIYNHECYTSFLKEELKESGLAEDFDDIRKLRNSLNYYGKVITSEDCGNAVKNIKNLIRAIHAKLQQVGL